jgi:hypothetical protein
MNKQKLNFQKIGLTIAILSIISMISAMHFFLFNAEMPVLAWFSFNSCFFSSLIFVIGFFLKNKFIMAVAIPFLLFYGTGGLFVFSWGFDTKSMIMTQYAHIVMTLAVFYIVMDFIKCKKWNSLILGISVGILIILISAPMKAKYMQSHPEYLDKLNDPKFTEYIMNIKIGR